MMTSSDPREPRPGGPSPAATRRPGGMGGDGADRSLILLGGALAALAVLTVLVVVLLAMFHVPLPGTVAAKTPTPLPTATPVEKALIQAPLTGAPNRNWPSGGQCQPQADGYHITANAICVSRYAVPADASIRVDVRQVSGLLDVSYGVTFRRASADGFYSFEIDGSGQWYCFKAAGGQLKPIASGRDPAIHKGLNATNSLLVRLSGPRFAFFVNGQAVGSATDAAYASGQVGLDGNERIEVVYTNFSASTTIG